MFYSQFILAKKGPLGTIWIAAHLERKLRKNQVADTDIGESVDSILFPDVPIALRLSSHLLLGVVRIYSRKVNYLFNDCSETLVKIKQAFRSSAVDLPPEASTAPYHSITLPETFDLDDLELPESSFCHGNFVDHHVTTREQITLQDPVEDTAYLGSQFGLDERFGDGDAPQMGLDFDEDIFGDRVYSPGPSSAAPHLEEDVCPSAAATEAACSNKMEIDGQQSSTPAIRSSHMDEEETRDHSTMQTIADHSGQQTARDFSDVLPPPVGEVANVASKVIHRPDLNKDIYPCPMVQGPSTPRLMDEILTAHVEEVPVSSSLQKNKLLNLGEGFVAAVPSQTGTPASYSASGLSKRLEQAEMVMLSQHCNSHQSEEMKVADTGIPNNEGVQRYKECPKEQLLLAQQEVLQQSSALHTHENVNLVRSANPLQEMMMKASKEIPTVASNSHYTASASSLAVGTTQSPSVNAYGFDVSKQMLPVHNMQIPSSSVQSTDTVFRSHDTCMLELQQLNQIEDWKKQSQSDSVSPEIAQISQMHCNQMSNTAIQQNPLAIPAISTYLSSQQFTPASGLQSAVGISGTQQLTIHGPPASATVVPSMQQVSAMEFQQLNTDAQSKQQVQFSAESQEHVQEANIRNSLMSTSIHDNVTAMPINQSYLSGQQFDLPLGFHSAVGTPCTQELPIHGFPSPLRPMPNKQEASTMGSIQHLNSVADKQQSYLGAQERVQLTRPDNFMASTSTQDFNKPMQSFTLSGEHHNISLSHLSTIRMPDTRQNPGNTPEPAYFATQKLLSPQRLHVTETSSEVPSIAATEGPWLRACNEEEKRRQSLHLSAAAGKYSLHGVQHVDPRTGDSASIFQSNDIPRVPTNIPLENTYTQSPSISIPMGEQGFSKGLADGSITTQPFNIPLEIGTNGKPRDVPSGNILQSARLPSQVGTFGAYGNTSSRSILDTCSFAIHTGTNAVSSHLASENIILQGNNFPKVTGSERFPTNITASKNSDPPSFQQQAFSIAYDELSNALSISQVQGAATSKSEHFESIQSPPETVKRSVPEIPVHETLRTSVNSIRHEPDIFGLKRPRAETETTREADRSATIAKQSVGSNKHHMMDRTPILKTVTPNPRSRSSLSIRSMDYIPHDDDVLASILGRTSSFKVKATPAKTASAKRPRPTPRTGRKRKAVIDIATVIDSNFIKQQLANTEDIRRVRKKAPCTLQEIRMIQKESQGHYIFFEPSIPGLCTELHDLYGQVFGSTGSKILLDDKDENLAEIHKIQEPASSLGPTNDSRLEKLERVRRPIEIVSSETQRRQELASSMGPTNDSAMEQVGRPFEIVSAETQRRQEPACSMGPTNDSAMEQVGRPFEIVSAETQRRQELASSMGPTNDSDMEQVGRPFEILSAETQKVQEPASRLSPINDSGMEPEHVRRPLEIVSQMESIGVYVDNAPKNNTHMGNADGIRVGLGNEYAKQEQGRLLGMLSVLKNNNAHIDNIHGKQEKEKPEEIAPAAESSGVHLDDFHKEPEQEKLQEHVYDREDTFNVHKRQDQEADKIVYMTEPSRLHMSDVYQKQEKERPTEMVSDRAMGREGPYVESSKIFTVAIHQNQDQERPQEIVVESDYSRARIGEVDQKQEKEQEMPKEVIYDIESSRMDVDDVQGKPASIAASLQSPSNVIYGSKGPEINKTIEASVMKQGNAFGNEVCVPHDNTLGGQFVGPHVSPLKPSWLAESHEKSLEDRRGLQGVAETCWASEGQKISTEDPEVASKKKDESNCLGENHRIHVLQGKEGANIQCVNEVSKIFCGSKTSYTEPNIAQDTREQNQEIPDIAILEHSPLNRKIEDTVKDCEYQNQVVCNNASLLPLQGKDSFPHNKDDLGESVDMTMPRKVPSSSVQNFGVENENQNEQVLVQEKSTEMFCKQPEVSEDISLRDRQDQQGTNPVVLHTATDEDEDFGFLGDADNTEFLVVDDDAQGEFDGRSKASVTEEDQIHENSGWSARTRAVSRYLKTVFESMDYSAKKPESENRQKLSLDRLLVGKRRKEAARMFFETLVLKTRDYVDVEQKDSFNDISICPRAKLMKANF